MGKTHTECVLACSSSCPIQPSVKVKLNVRHFKLKSDAHYNELLGYSLEFYISVSPVIGIAFDKC